VFSLARLAPMLGARRRKELGVSLRRSSRVHLGIRFILSGNLGFL
jgi:hypothetical protein